MSERPTKKALRAMKVLQLLQGLLLDERHRSHYVAELHARIAQVGTNDLRKLIDLDGEEPVSGEKEISPPPTTQVPDARQMATPETIVNYMKEMKTASSLAPLCNTILDSEWNYVDPRRKMRMEPYEVSGFLESLRDNEDHWENLSTSQQGFLRMICHSMLAWMRISPSYLKEVK